MVRRTRVLSRLMRPFSRHVSWDLSWTDVKTTYIINLSRPPAAYHAAIQRHFYLAALLIRAGSPREMRNLHPSGSIYSSGREEAPLVE